MYQLEKLINKRMLIIILKKAFVILICRIL